MQQWGFLLPDWNLEWLAVLFEMFSRTTARRYYFRIIFIL